MSNGGLRRGRTPGRRRPRSPFEILSGGKTRELLDERQRRAHVIHPRVGLFRLPVGSTVDSMSKDSRMPGDRWDSSDRPASAGSGRLGQTAHSGGIRAEG